ncbi:unnamed protein product [Diamesa serratosioi]
MSSLGNRGEREQRNPKTKFAALDINSLYKSSLGEPTEPTAQKNAVPRKHGMQSLGKVPSARRPPTNLPSLKAETLTPPSSIQSTNEPQNTQSQASWADSNSSSVPSGNNKKNNNTSNTVAIKTISNSNQLNTNNQQQQQHQQNQQQQRGGDTRDSSNLSTSPSSTSWSVVATGGNLKEEILPHPPIYQSPQFQNEFPSLDGSILANVNVIQQKTQQQNQYHNSTEIGGNANSSLNLRPQTDAASWMQQQQQSNSGNVRGAGAENGQQNYQPDQDHLNAVPSKFMALMPSFMLRGQSGGGGGGGGGGQQQPQQQQQQQQMNTSNHQSSNSHHQNSNNNNNNNYHQQNQGRTNQGRNINNNNNNNNNYGGGGGGGNGGQYNDYSNSQNSMRRQPAPRHSGGNNNHQRGGQNDERNSSAYEPDAISQRPIIKEEELDRIDSLAKDDGWAKHDEIDYNKKLQFSDDENMEEISSAKPKMQILQHDEMNNMRHSKNDDQSGWREKELRYERSERDEKKQTNGPRPVDPLLADKMNKRREEEERLERERKLAAQKKLLELEEKSKQKNNSSPAGSLDKDNDEKVSYTTLPRANSDNNKERNDYMNKYNDRDRDMAYNDGYRGGERGGERGGDFKKSSFQTNLPPRFQKQHMDRNDVGSKSSGGNDRNYNNNNNRGPPDSKNIPFSQQQYDQRWMYPQHKQNSSQQQQQPRRNMSSLSQSSSDDNRRDSRGDKSGQGYRRRQESEEDDYGRYGVKDTGIKLIKSLPQQITRSMSDSSHDDKLSDHNISNRSEKSLSREFLGSVCWAEVCESEKKTKEYSSIDKNRRVSESSALSDDQPKQILQRNKPLQELQKKDMKDEGSEKKSSVLSESPPKSTSWAESVDESSKKSSIDKVIEKDGKSDVKTTPTTITSTIESKKSLESIPEKTNASDKDKLDVSKVPATKEIDDRNKRSPRAYDSIRDPRGAPRRGGGHYNSSYHSGSTNYHSTGGMHGRGNNDQELSDSDYSDDGTGPRKDTGVNRDSRGGSTGYISTGTQQQKEGFSPRGEPSRRGRGGMAQAPGFRRSGSSGTITAPVKRIDNYGPPSSKSPFGSGNDDDKKEKSQDKMSDDERTKMKQKLLSEGLLNKNQKDNSNIVTKSIPATVAAPIAVQAGVKIDETTVDKKSFDGDDKMSIDDKNFGKGPPGAGIKSHSNSAFNTGANNMMRNKTRPDEQRINTSAQPSTKPPGSKPVQAPMSATSGGGKTNAPPASTPSYSSMSANKPIDNRNPINRDTRDIRGDPRHQQQQQQQQQQQRDPRAAPRFVKQREHVGNNPNNTGNMNRMPGAAPGNNYWDKNSSVPSENIHQQQQLISDESKMQMSMQLNTTNSSSNQVPTPSNVNSTILKTDPKQILDGTTLPKTTLIFENTSYKTGPSPSMKRSASNQSQQKDPMEMIDTQQQQQKQQEQSLTSAMQNLSFSKSTTRETEMDMKFAFAYAEISQLTEDKTGGFGSNVSGTTSNQSQSGQTKALGALVGKSTGSQNSNSLNTAELNKKVASCKGVWEEPPMQNPIEQHMHSNQQTANANVCKVKPTQQQMHQSGLSPPPQMQQNPLQQQQQQQPYYQPTQYQGMSAIPSPPAVVYNSQASGGLYNPFTQLDAARQIYGYQGAAGNNSAAAAAAGTMPFNAYMQTNLSTGPTHEMYQNLTQYRANVQTPFNQTQQLTNPVLMTSTSNSLMSASVKSNPQQIGAIGSKSQSQTPAQAANVNQYGQQQQQFMNLYHQQHNSYYTNSAAQQANPYYSAGPPTGSVGSGTQSYPAGIYSAHGAPTPSNGPPQQQISNFAQSQFLGSQLMNNLVISQQYRSGPSVSVNSGGNGNGGNGNNAPPGGGYMKQNQQQQQSHMQDPNGRPLKSPISVEGNLKSSQSSPPHKMYPTQSSGTGNWENPSTTPTNSSSHFNNSNNNNNNNRMYGNNSNMPTSNSPATAAQQQQQQQQQQSQSGQRWPTPIQRPSPNSYNNNGNTFNNNNHPYYQNSHFQPRPQRPNPGQASGGNNSGNGGTNMSMMNPNKSYFGNNGGGNRINKNENYADKTDKNKAQEKPVSSQASPTTKSDSKAE